MKQNEELQKDVQAAILWEPKINAAEIGVAAKDGVVTLTGTVDSFQKKKEAEEAAKSVKGVRALVEKIEVQLPVEFKKNDNQIAADILSTFKWNWEIPENEIVAKVELGWVTLSGEVKWNFQKIEAAKALARLEGVRGVTNNIKLVSGLQDGVEQTAVEGALLRNWSMKDLRLKVEVAGNTVKLTGRVHSFYQKDEAERIAWNAPGVMNVHNELLIEYDY